MIGLERERGRRREGRILTLFLLPGIGYGPLCKKSQPANTVLVPSRHSLLPPCRWATTGENSNSNSSTVEYLMLGAQQLVIRRSLLYSQPSLGRQQD